MSELSVERILQEVSIWSRNRRLYPGWLVAPHEVRQRIWDFTDSWIEPVLAAGEKLGAEQFLWVLYELNWRLEAALLPMLTDVAAAVEKVLLYCYQGARNANTEDRGQLDVAVPTKAATLVHPTVRAMWKDLAFAILRFHREERHHEAFNRWLDRLAKAEPLSNDERSRVCYERALRGLGDLDDDQAFDVLNDWPNNCRDPIWAVRKASVYAELGKLDEAASLASEALDKFRHHTLPQAADISNLSREGWTMCLLHNIAWARHFESQSRPVPQLPRGRWARLSQVQCNPQSELEWFESRLDQPAPVTPPRVTQEAGFAPGERRTTYHGGDQGLWNKLSVAYQFMRLIEDAPYLPALGNVGLSGKPLRNVAEWFIEHDPVRTRTLVLRLRDKDLTNTYLSRHRVAALPRDSLTALHALATHAVENSLPKLTGGESRSDPVAERKRRRLSTSIDVLSRTVIRADVDEGLKLWDRALQLYESPAVRFDFQAPKAVFQLFRSLMRSLSDDALALRFRQIVELPIPGSKSFHVLNSLDWRELTRDFQTRLPSLPDNLVGDDWATVIEPLLQAARAEKPQVRRNAIVRLAALLRYGCLDESARKMLAEAYWSQVSPDGLPRVEGLLSWMSLVLPEPELGLSVSRFRTYACRSRAESKIDSNLMHDWIRATRIDQEPLPEKRRFVDWDLDELRSIVGQMKNWWGQFDIAAEKRRENDTSQAWMQSFGQVSYRECASIIVDVLRYVVIPRIQNDADMIVDVANLIDDFSKHGVPHAALLPALQILQPDRDVAPEMRRALASHEPDVYCSALNGLVHWLQLRRNARKIASGTTFPELPTDLLRELGMIVATRRQPGLLEALNTVAWVLQNCPEVVDPHFLDSVFVMLQYLWTETKYRDFGSDSDRIPYSEVPEYRERAVRIASLLRKTTAAKTDEVHQWLAVAVDDPLPEIRRAIGSSVFEGPELVRAVTAEELIKIIEAAIPEQVPSQDKETLFATFAPLFQRAEFASFQGVVPVDEQVQLAALLVVRISQTLSSAKAARSAIRAIVSRIITSPGRMSNAASADLHRLAVQDDLSQPDETMLWLRDWAARTETRGKKAVRSKQDKRRRVP